MSAIYFGSSFVRASHRSVTSSQVCTRCATRYIHHQGSLQKQADGANSETRTTPARPATKRQSSQLAGRIIQGLRRAAPGGFAKKSDPPLQDSSSEPRSFPSTPTTKDGIDVSTSSTVQQRVSTIARKQPRAYEQKQDQSKIAERGNEFEHYITRTDGSKVPAIVATLQESDNPAAEIKASQKARDLPLVTRFLKGKVVRFANEEEKQRVLKLAKEQVNKHLRGKEDVKLAPLPKVYLEELNQKAIAGKYEPIQGVHGNSPRQQIMSHLKTTLQFNGSYSASQKRSLMEFVEKMWPTQKPGTAARA
ncbi:uncharacterized protein PV09_01668 [Verruconis gallopava]|uniref:Uncharacterized protein n=1 Tax=Verruconis gallopava TaxID=253628 RepID=A0A0D2ALU3_9PEZI|nr:uncharacterized protein PV09_01668 [Verruconis gallopava]KIW07738.1 hypothetical protein PV09_01668 [Verruconis gallopava]